MKNVKQIVNYWCDDTMSKRFLGQGIGVAILDTGISYHPDFDKRIICFKDALYGKKKIYDDNGHGTHVSGIIGGNGYLSGGMYAGMAPFSNIVSVKILDSNGNGCIKNVIAGIYWILDHYKRYKIRIINISIGTKEHRKNKEEEKLLNAVEALWDEGLIVTASAGNYGPQERSITVPGVSKKIITVGALNDPEQEALNYSGRGPTMECVIKPDLIAPGTFVTSCNGNYKKSSKTYITKSGTSMATPVVSGAIAVLLSKYPDMTNVEVKLKLRDSCVDMGENRNFQGWGLLNVKELLKNNF